MLILSFVTPVTPLRIFNSSAVEVTLPILLRSAAVDVIAVPPIWRLVMSTVPPTVTLPLDNTIRSTSSVCPILAPSITILSTVTLPAVISLVPISILPNPFAIDPEDKAPTVIISLLPAFTAKLASAAVFVYLAVNPAWTFSVKLDKWFRLLELIPVAPCNIFNSLASASTSRPLSWSFAVFNSPCDPYTTIAPLLITPAPIPDKKFISSAVASTFTAEPEAPKYRSVVCNSLMCLLASTTIALLAVNTPAVAPTISFRLCKDVSVNSSVPTRSLLTLRSLYELIVMSLDELSVAVVLTTAKWSCDSSQINATLLSVPLSISRPASETPEAAPEERTINGSLTVIFWVSTVVCVPLTVRLPLITKLLPVILPVVVKLLLAKSIPLAPEELILPLAILISPIEALVVTVNVPEEDKESAEIPLLASYITALLATAVPTVAPSRRLISSLSAVTPVRILSSASLDVTEASLLISAPEAVISTPPKLKVLVTNPVVVVVPLTVTELLANVIKSVSAPWPIVSVPTLTLPTSSDPDLIRSVPISIEPNPSVIEPELSAPTSVMVLTFAIARNLASAAVFV